MKKIRDFHNMIFLIFIQNLVLKLTIFQPPQLRDFSPSFPATGISLARAGGPWGSSEIWKLWDLNFPPRLNLGRKPETYYRVNLTTAMLHKCLLTRTMTKSRQVHTLEKYLFNPKANHFRIISTVKRTAKTKLTIFRMNFNSSLSCRLMSSKQRDKLKSA